MASGASRAHGRDAAQSVAFSTAACASRPALVNAPSVPIQPRAANRATAPSHASSVQPRTGCMSSRRRSRQ
ncbi:MAG TPA: hypothetical protein VMK84_30885, partial [Streptosporangiaceae bacterium]|nr:hypothetical protein [Streptosporangiaceae bacterium]